ncbi:hypothetical protein L1887_38493 [Cichorium endivia]|nr:hypothetical protein L1887_38493 [Cichorium endivia]
MSDPEGAWSWAGLESVCKMRRGGEDAAVTGATEDVVDAEGLGGSLRLVRKVSKVVPREVKATSSTSTQTLVLPVLNDLQPKAKCEGQFGKTKSGAIKIYDYLKKGKRELKSADASTTSSFSRLCLSKTPSSLRGTLSSDMKRFVRFYPGTVIVDEYLQRRGRKSLNVERFD